MNTFEIGDKVKYDAGYTVFYGQVIGRQDAIQMQGAVLIGSSYRCRWESASNPKWLTADEIAESGWISGRDLEKVS